MLVEEEGFEIVTEESSSLGNHINLSNNILASEVRDRGTANKSSVNRHDSIQGKQHGKLFFKRSNKRSAAKPPNGCWICGSPEHFKIDCPHAGKMTNYVSINKCSA
jgi:hypothetical protein